MPSTSLQRNRRESDTAEQPIYRRRETDIHPPAHPKEIVRHTLGLMEAITQLLDRRDAWAEARSHR